MSLIGGLFEALLLQWRMESEILKVVGKVR